MPDVYVSVTDAPRAILENLMVALGKRAADPQLRAMLTTYLTDASLPAGSRVLEVGCGTGAVTRSIATWPGVSAAIGGLFVATARELACDVACLNAAAAAASTRPAAASASAPMSTQLPR